MPRQGRRDDRGEEERERRLTLLKFLGLSEALEPEPKEEVVDELLAMTKLPCLGIVYKCRICDALFVSLGDFERHRLNPDPLCQAKRA